MTVIASSNENWTFPLCPQSPDTDIDWAGLKQLGWIQAMDGCAQDPEYHAEGDVLQHTQLVCEALSRLDSWKNLDHDSRSVLFAAALLHDVAKPATTKIGDSGRITSLKHTRVGASMTRDLLLRAPEFCFPALEYREQIVNLVRHSGLPIWFIEKEDPVKTIVKASMSVRLDWLGILAEADLRGRQCDEQAELLKGAEMFREFCLENGCYDAPRSFPSEHSRFHYFHSERGDLAREVFDDTGSTVTILSGLPGAGKDSWIKSNAPALPVVSLDSIRISLGVDPEDSQAVVIARARQQALEYLRARQDFAWNATNVSRTMRSNLIAWMQPYNPRIKIVYLEAPNFETLKLRNRQRRRPVPEPVLMRLLRRLEVPNLSECHELTIAITG